MAQLTSKKFVSIRTKLMGILLLATLIALGANVLVSSHIFVHDKASYVYDYILGRVQNPATLLDQQIHKIMLLGKVLYPHARHQNSKQVQRVFKENAGPLKLKKMMVFNLSQEGDLSHFASLGDEDGTLAHSLDQLGWDSVRFLNSTVLIGKTQLGELAIGTLIREGEDGGVGYVFIIQPDFVSMDSAIEFHFFIVDSIGDLVFPATPKLKEFNRKEMSEILRSVLDDKTSVGVKKWTVAGTSYFLGYQRSTFKEFMTLGVTPERVVFGAVKSLLIRLIFISLSSLVIGAGIVLWVTQKMTEALDSMMEVLTKAVHGETKLRVQTSGMSPDEIGMVAQTFNQFVGRIDDLMAETANQAEQKYEQERLEIFQSQLITQRSLETATLTLAAQVIHAQPPGGEWYFHDKIGDYVLLLIGKSEGKTLSSAVMVGVIRGAASSFCSALKATRLQSPHLDALMTYLNSAVFEASQGKTKVQCFGLLLDTVSGEVQMMNASYPSPYLYREAPDKDPTQTADFFESVKVKNSFPLGTQEKLKVHLENFNLKPGDMLIWFSNSFLSTPGAQGEVLSTLNMFEILAGNYKGAKGKAESMMAKSFEKIGELLGDNLNQPIDDLSLVVIGVSKSANFLSKDEVA